MAVQPLSRTRNSLWKEKKLIFPVRFRARFAIWLSGVEQNGRITMSIYVATMSKSPKKDPVLPGDSRRPAANIPQAGGGPTVAGAPQSGQRLKALDDSFARIAAGLEGGRHSAQIALFSRYYEPLRVLAERYLHRQLRGVVGGDDAVNSALATFFERAGTGTLELTDWNSLWGLLHKIVRRKCTSLNRRFLARKRGGNGTSGGTCTVTWPADFPPLESSRDHESSQGGLTTESGEWDAVEDGPTPAEAAMLQDTVDLWFSRLGRRKSSIVLLLMYGYTEKEVADKLVCSERTVRRVRALAREVLVLLANMPADGPPPP
jgi:DNA-directed RNA polymerase specialized sigma24 family protein